MIEYVLFDFVLLNCTADIPSITRLTLGDNSIIKSGDDVVLTCQYNETVEPLSVSWFYEGQLVKASESSKNVLIETNDKESVLTLKALQMATTGRYSCRVENRAGVDQETLDVNIKGMNGYLGYHIMPSVGLDFILKI